MSGSRKEQMYENWLGKHLKWLCESTYKIDLVRIYAGDGILNDQSDKEIKSCPGGEKEKFSILYNKVKEAGFTKIDVIIRALEESDQSQVANEFNHIKKHINNAVPTDEEDEVSDAVDFETNETPLIVTVKSGTNKFALSKTNEKQYRNVSNPRGFALIVLNENYPKRGMKREGAINDLHYMLNLFRRLKYEVMLKRDINAPRDMESILIEFKNQFSKTEVDSCVVICMGHGESNGLIMINGETLNIWTDLIYRFDNTSCPQLINKPKIFIFQACQNFSDDNSQSPVSSNIYDPRYQPAISDVLVCLSTIPGCVSFRDPYLGSWFIYCLTEIFMDHAHNSDIEDLLRMTDNRMAKIRDGNNLKQVSGKYTIAFKKFYFNV